MTTDPQPHSYPAAYSLHAHLANPKTLQKVLGTPHLLKLRKAYLPGYVAADNCTVASAGYGFGEWQGEAKVKGVVHYVSDESEERKLRDFVCLAGGIGVREMEFEVVKGGIWGRKEWVRGWGFEREGKAEEEKNLCKGKQRAKEVEQEEDETEADDEEEEGMSEPDDYQYFLHQDEIEIKKEPTRKQDAHDPIPAKLDTTPQPNIVSSHRRPSPHRTPSPAYLEAHHTPPPPATPQYNTHEQDATPCASQKSSTPPAHPDVATKSPCAPAGPQIASTNVHDDRVVKSLVAMYENMGI